MINVLCRPLVAAVCCVFVLLAGFHASAQQQFLNQSITSAQSIDADMKREIAGFIDPYVTKLVIDQVDPEAISAARKKLLETLNNPSASAAFKEAFSVEVTTRLDPAVNHKDELVRLNAMIVLSGLVDDGSKVLIDAGLVDDNVAVKRWAMKALGKRAKWWQQQAKGSPSPRPLQIKIADAVKQIVAMLNQDPAPHPIVVNAGFDALQNIDDDQSRSALVTLLNKRVALHAADPNLSYSAERSAVDRFSSTLAVASKVDIQSVKALNRAMSRYCSLILKHSQAQQIEDDQRNGANTMLFQCLQGLAQTSAAAGKSRPDDPKETISWIKNARWDDLTTLVEKDWANTLKADPFKLSAKDLGIE